MKTLFSVIISVISVTQTAAVAFAADPSDFERGYIAGLKSCTTARESWFCRVPTAANNRNCNDNNISGMGYSRADAVLQIGNACLKTALERGYEVECQKI
jgi:hypothetical protein